MNTSFDPAELVSQPIARRLWLLHKAAEAHPLDQALVVARLAEAFIVGSNGHQHAADACPNEAAPDSPMRCAKEGIPRRNGLNITDDARERLMERLTAGDRNVDLAREFGLTPRQVQGIRMGSARRIAERRERPRDAPDSERTAVIPASEDDVVRYLRQQDDVIVRSEDGVFCLNGRFRMVLSELVAKANRIRVRQGKPTFALIGFGAEASEHATTE